MKKIALTILLVVSLQFIYAQKVAIVGVNHITTLDDVSILALEDLNVGENYYFTDNEYDNAANQFVDMTESVVKITITTKVTKGNVIVIKETSANTYASSVTPGGGSVSTTHYGGSFSLTPFSESMYLYTDTDNDPSNGVTEIHAAFFGGLLTSAPTSGGPMPASENPSSDFPNAIVLHNFPVYNTSSYPNGIGRVEYKTSVLDRTDVNKVKLENPSNYITFGSDQDLSSTFFTNFGLVTANPVVTLTRNTSQLNENSGSSFSYTFQLDKIATSDIVVSFSVNGGNTNGIALYGSDYTQSGATSMNTTSGTVTIANGTSSKIVTLTPSADGILEPDETLELTIISGSGYDFGSPSTASSIILNDDTKNVEPLVAITGIRPYPSVVKKDSEFSFVALKDITAGSVFYFTSENFDKSLLTFTDNPSIAPTLKWVAPAGGVLRGDVIVVRKTAPGAFSLTCNGSSGASCGTITRLNSSRTWSISETHGLFISYTDTDDNPYNGISEAHCVVYTYDNAGTFGGTIPVADNLTSFYPGCVLVDGFPSQTPNRFEYKPTQRPTITVDQANFENPTNWLYAQASQNLSAVPFNNITISEGSVNPKASVTNSVSSLIEGSGNSSTYTFTLDNPATANTVINFSVSGSAVYNTDYSVSGATTFTNSTGSITITTGNSSAQLSLTPINESVLETTEDVLLTITSGTGYDGGSPGSASVNITNDDTDDTEPSLAILGINHLAPSGLSVVAMKDIPANSTFYFLRGDFDTEELTFPSTTGKIKLVTPSTCISKGTVLSITGASSGPLTVHCNGTSGSTCGTATIVGGGFSFLTVGTQHYAYQDDDSDPSNGIKQIHAVLHTGGSEPSIYSGGSLPPASNPKLIYSKAILVDGFPTVAPNRAEFDPTKRNASVSTALIENTANWLHAQPNAPLSTVNFTIDSTSSAKFTASSFMACTYPVDITFTDQSTNASSWFWDFGDSTNSNQQNPIHRYGNDGVYEVTLTVSGTDVGCFNTYKKEIVVEKLNSNFSVSQTSGCGAITVDFTDISTISSTSGMITAWAWDFGDGNTSNLQNPSHTYNTTGLYTVSLTITSSNGCSSTHTKANYIESIAAPPLSASFLTNPALGCAIPHTVFFTDKSTNPDTWNWNFGDGQTSTLQNPVHNYVSNGVFIVSLTVTDTIYGCTDVFYDTVEVSNSKASIGGSANEFGCGPLLVNFTDASTSTLGIASWAWTFGDGGTSNLQNPSHTYQTPGVYTVSLTITDSAGCTNTDEKTNYVQVIGPDVNFGPDITNSSCTPLTVSFKDSTVFSAPIVQWLWTFGDGNTSNLQNPNHTYTMKGTFTVSLKVTDIDGCQRTLTKTDLIAIADTVKPTVSNPGNQSEARNSSCNFVIPDYTGLAAASDNCGTPTVIQTPTAGTIISSNTTVKIVATDASNNKDSVTFNILLNDATSSSTDKHIACNTYTWIDGNTYTTSNNTATYVLPNAAGCDSMVTLDLTVNHSNTGTDIITACNSYTWIDGETYTTNNNTAQYTLTNMNNCDSVVTLDLTILNSATGTDVITACNNYTWVNGINYSGNNNTATHTFVGGASSGCDSVVTLDLTIINPTTGVDVISACHSYTWINGITYTGDNNTATYTIVGGASSGCDSVVTLDLTILNPAMGTDIISACDSYTWINGITYTGNNNTATHTISGGASSGCDSIVTLNLTILKPALGTDIISSCGQYTWLNGITYTGNNNSATYTYYGEAANGCDSIVTLDLTINPIPMGIDVRTECNSLTWIDGKTYTSHNNTSSYTIIGGAANGCDSVVLLDLTIINSATGTDIQTACNSYTWIDGNTYTASNNMATYNLVRFLLAEERLLQAGPTAPHQEVIERGKAGCEAV